MAFYSPDDNVVNMLNGRGAPHQLQSIVGVNFNAPTKAFVDTRKNLYPGGPNADLYGDGVGAYDIHRLRVSDLCFKEIRSGDDMKARRRCGNGPREKKVHGFAAFNGLPKTAHVKFVGVSTQTSQIDIASGGPEKVHLLTTAACDILNNSDETFEFGDAVYWMKPVVDNSRPKYSSDYGRGDRFVAVLKKMKFFPEARNIVPEDGSAECKLGQAEYKYMEEVKAHFPVPVPAPAAAPVAPPVAANPGPIMTALKNVCDQFATLYGEEKKVAEEIHGFDEFGKLLIALSATNPSAAQTSCVKAYLMTWPQQRRQAFIEQHYLGMALGHSDPGKNLYIDLKPK